MLELRDGLARRIKRNHLELPKKLLYVVAVLVNAAGLARLWTPPHDAHWEAFVKR